MGQLIIKKSLLQFLKMFPMDKKFKCWKFEKLMCQRMPIGQFFKKIFYLLCVWIFVVLGVACRVSVVEHRLFAVAYRRLFSCGTWLCSGQAQQQWQGLSCPTAYGTLVSRPGIKPFICTGRRIPNHWTTREVPDNF